MFLNLIICILQKRFFFSLIMLDLKLSIVVIWLCSCSLCLILTESFFDALISFILCIWNNFAFKRVWFCKFDNLQPGSSTQLVKLIYWIICECWTYTIHFEFAKFICLVYIWMLCCKCEPNWENDHFKFFDNLVGICIVVFLFRGNFLLRNPTFSFKLRI